MKKTSTLHVLGPFLRRQWGALVVAGLATVVVAAAEVLRPFPLKFVIDRLFGAESATGTFELGNSDLWLLAGIAGLVLAIALMEAAGSYLMDVRLARAGERIVHDLRIAIYSHLQRLSLGFHQRRHHGDLVTRVTGDVNAVGTVFSSSLGTLVSAGLTLVGMVVVGFLLDPVLALVAFASTPILAVIAFRFRRRMRTLARRQRAVEGEIASLAAETLSSMQQVKALGSERYEHERLQEKSEERLEAGYEATIVEGRFTRVLDVVGAIGTAAVLVVGVFRVSAGALSPGDLVVMVAYARRAYRPLRSIAREWVRFSRAMARAERVAEILSADELLEERRAATPEGTARGELVFDDVSFSYDSARPALVDVSVTIPAGERVAVVGPSGAGKSTLAALAARFYDPDKGSVRLDGVDARDLPVDWLRDQVGFVLQDAVLFTGTVAENIAWGIDAEHEDVVRAAEAAGADDFIRELPAGYDTQLDPGGTGLSGGQRQRIAIARTLLRDPAVLLLDEPTTGLDAKSAADVLAGLDVLMSGRTTVIITHDRELALRAERAILLEDGRVVETGAPEALVKRGGRPGRTPGVDDPGLPHASALLDPDEAAAVLARSFNGGAPLDVGIRYLRYKPGTNLVVHYDVDAAGTHHEAVGMIASSYLGRRAVKPENVALAREVGSRAAADAPLAYDDDLGCLIQWYPLDLALPALAHSPGRLRWILATGGLEVEDSDEEPERLAYKPRRRAVLKVDGHVVKLYRREGEFQEALAGLRASSKLRPSLAVPEFEAAFDSELLIAQSYVDGRPVSDAAGAAGEAGAVLALLHASQAEGVDTFGPVGQLVAAGASAALVGTVAPELRPRLDTLLASLTATAPDDVTLVPSHGDFNARQLLVANGDLAVTDFDSFCLAPAALDLATYLAYHVRGGEADLGVALSVLEDLVAGYGGRPPNLSWYLATMILRRAARPFRYFEPDWQRRVQQMVAAAEAVHT